MAGTFTQIYIQLVFAVRSRENLLQKPWRDEVFKYMSGITRGKRHKAIIVNGVTDHVHLFVGMKPVMSVSDLVREIKNNASNFINKKKFIIGRFSWQDGYGAFSYAYSQIENVFSIFPSSHAASIFYISAHAQHPLAYRLLRLFLSRMETSFLSA